ncbi:MAG: aminotransferase class V-fold PLP-dependent enzyme [Bacteroidia bacterium]|nr:MAG: aminotransferase class V-fold PLP-dependent enzyme [Bacteroidia bacterium]
MHELSWEKIRKDFKLTGKVTYFQSAGMSPIPKAVYKTIQETYGKLYELGELDFHSDLSMAAALLQKMGEHLNTLPENLVFMPNSSLAMSMVALSMKRRFGNDFNIVSKQDEFPATHIPFEYQNIPVSYVQPENGRYPVEKIMALTDDKTKAVVCSYVQYGTGFRQDMVSLGKALKQRDLLFVVNATQGFPFFPIDVEKMHIDVLTASLHKWGCAGHVGSLMYTSPAYREQFPTPVAGWLSVKPVGNDFIVTRKGTSVDIYPTAMQYQFGTANLQTILALKTAFEYMQNIGFDNIRKRVLSLVTECIAHLNQLDGVQVLSPHSHAGEQSAIISINLSGKSNQECVLFLEKEKVFTTIRNNNIRISLNFFNNHEDIGRLVEGIRKFMAQ